MAFNVTVQVDGENCDRCRKPMNEADPGVSISISTRVRCERQSIWLHISCVEWYVLNTAKRQLADYREAHAKVAEAKAAASK